MLKKICSDDTIIKKPKYYCKKCDYYCDKLFLYKQHCNTKKHTKEKCSKMLKKYALDFYKCECGRKYQHIQSYKRHKKKCEGACNVLFDVQEKKNEQLQEDINKNIEDNENVNLRGMISTLIRQNENILMENKEMRKLVKDIIPKIGNNNTTINKFNLQVFLNEKCKDAINMSDFVETIRLEVDDLDATRQNGYVSGITNIFVRGLRQLELHKRPIHCSDLKREVLYVKDNNSWEKDSDNKTMKNAITTLAKRQIDIIEEWEANNHDWNSTENGTQRYIDMIRNVTNGDEIMNENKIIKTIAKEVTIEKGFTNYNL